MIKHILGLFGREIIFLHPKSYAQEGQYSNVDGQKYQTLLPLIPAYLELCKSQRDDFLFKNNNYIRIIVRHQNI